MPLCYRVKMHPRDIITKQLPVLMHEIDVNDALWARLIELGLFTSSEVEYIKVSTGSILLYGRD